MMILLLTLLSYPIFNFTIWSWAYDDCPSVSMSFLQSSYQSSLHSSSSIDSTFLISLNESFISLNSSMYQPLLDRAELFIFTLFSFLFLIHSTIVPSLTLILANLVDTYLLGFLAVFIIFSRYFYIVGNVIVSYLFYLFISKLELYLLLLFFVESFSISFQSLTLTNRLSINLIAGSLIVNLLSSVLLFTFRGILFGFLYILIFTFELFQLSLQLFIFCLLHYSFNSITFILSMIIIFYFISLDDYILTFNSLPFLLL